ncbi:MULTISPECIES: sigma-70 family RNA polymerase sigma factor [Paenibacillus]|uniref:sigma-70 family RNA polymerase sigma factor n=1 Tax=Paenibacillus TaxID=44249 RepID=UPI000F53042D|nr:sigma-70 family RNA polymerase sigma factor [Paenibacillus xylanexedens]
MTLKTKEEVSMLALSASHGDNIAFGELVGVAEPLLVSLANRFSSYHHKFEFDDFYSVGLLALYKACQSFKAENPSFLDYAKLVILRAYWREIEYYNQGKRNVFENREVEMGDSDDFIYSDDLSQTVFLSDFREQLNLIIDDCFDEKKAQIIRMHIMQDMKVCDIASETRLNYKHVHKIIERGTQKIKKEYASRYVLDKNE